MTPITKTNFAAASLTWINKRLAWLDQHFQDVSVRARLLALCLGLFLILGSSNLLLGYVVQQREGQEDVQKQQYDRLQAITAVSESITTVRHYQGQVNVAQLIADDELARAIAKSLSNAESQLEAALSRVDAFDPQSVHTVRVERQLSLLATKKSVEAILAKAADTIPTARDAIGHLNTIEKTLNDAAARERLTADEISADQISSARSAVRLSRAIIFLAVLLGLIVSLLILRSIVQPLQITIAALRQINAGESMVDLPPISNNEFGDMALALRQFRDQADRLRHMAYTDEITGLGNRAHFDETLRHAVAAAREAGLGVALMYIDIDNFSTVNDSLGHGAGDRYLREAALRLQRFIPLEAQVWRYSGDKFTVQLDAEAVSDVEASRETVSAQAETILRGMNEPFLLDGHLLSMSVSIGIALFPADGDTDEQLMSSADAAMYLVKDSGRNGLRFANPDLTAGARKDLLLTADIRRGIEQREFEPFYQPIVDAVAGRVVGAEALLRWRHPERGVRTAQEFIFVAEANGMVHALGDICLTRVCERIALWQAEAEPIWISVNLSTRQIDDRSIISLLESLQSRHPFRPEGLTLEITESAMLEQVDRAQQTLEAVRSQGYRLGVDDFGTGYSSMVYLQRFPVDKIKIDRSFVNEVETSRSAVAIIAATVTLAKGLDLDVIAEGVETEGQMRRLVELGCVLQQGYYYTPALPADQFESWRANWVPPSWS